MKKTTTMRERIAVRAYFAWLAGSMAGAETDWLEAEAVEIVLAERRRAAATKAAASRRAKAKAPAEMLVNLTRRPVICRPTAH